jgi:hypothetical protein
MPQAYSPSTLEADHVTPEKLGGESTFDNLALACFHCNNNKGPNIAGIDPENGERAFLFDPRAQIWTDHFVWAGPLLRGRTGAGRATIRICQINRPDRVAVRAALMNEGVFPPP